MRRKYTDEMLIEAARVSRSVTDVCRNLGITYVSGSQQTHISNRLKKLGVDTSHFVGNRWNLGKTPVNRLTAKEILIERTSGVRQKRVLLVRALLEIGRPYECERCGNDGNWNNSPLRLEVHHKDENPLNNKSDNLGFFCPNCHTQEDDKPL